ncbi:SH3 domain-containing protein [Streptomyces sp. HUCO-GS316]|uniref:SH3 domain-containing protein n=1 Tax=Streptomyces sp. HUCO-GS316 TaxID=2692198 RepID=UPI001367A113|nr:SH3 domain-containing protein [Streptomyces sp. HUCO-GS316]MXM65332.1 SH3 domain-containing protein [Streptomyces sp. HUCO-GS316]
MRNRVTVAALALVAAALSAPVSAAPAAVAAEPPGGATGGILSCTHSHRDVDPTSGEATSTSVPRRSGPHAACGSNPVRSIVLDYNCSTNNESGNKWTYVTVRSTGASGWVYSGNLTDGGSEYEC